MIKVINSARRGFTLLETLLYMVIFGIVIGGLTTTGILIAQSGNESLWQAQMVSEASATFNQVIRELEKGVSFNSANSNLDQQLSVINFTNIEGNNVVLDVSNSILRKDINSGGATAMHSSDLQVTEFRIKRFNASAQRELFQLTIVFTNSNGQEFNLTTSLNFQ